MPEHYISKTIEDLVRREHAAGNRWLAYNTVSYFIEAGDIAFFRKEEDAHEHCWSNISDYDCYTAIPMQSADAALHRIRYGEERPEETIISTPKNLNNMNQKNLDYLKESLKYLGFGDKLNPTLEKNIQQGFSEFILNHEAEYNNQKIEAALYFKRGDQNDMFFFNKYEATLKNESNPSRERSQNFYVGNKNSGFTLKEAFNLLNGRAVNKDLVNNAGDQYNAWIQFELNEGQTNNFKIKQFHQNYGFDLVKTLSAFPIKELAVESQRELLLKSLQKGNIQSATIEKEGVAHKVFIEAEPQFKTVNLYNEKMQRIPREAVEQYKSVQVSDRKEVKEEQKPDGKDQAKENTQKYAPEKKSLLPKKDKPQLLEKKRTSEKKGLHL